ncbi:hypothetical protein HYPBUDRAFT_151188 [Hyphopichia burtonii NRRL Y-1933]|uniref:Uncharacterized protein n=1 Tax=Hyphopichia burtonii NRRL Y-1933 TaxID=984485 RepID=A0A1E4RQD2_9ASCO|nr:hypothetical protein HYPBUDRAFT_151188 [Hyphopichia burtonii NRRL Y-1933]ODV69411.1 hypothetical protein HYPBUDRAFT_151188 [Hyphopichia burtonii NRRL Y-1933]
MPKHLALYVTLNQCPNQSITINNQYSIWQTTFTTARLPGSGWIVYRLLDKRWAT